MVQEDVTNIEGRADQEMEDNEWIYRGLKRIRREMDPDN